jgi:hypothetical protein
MRDNFHGGLLSAMMLLWGIQLLYGDIEWLAQHLGVHIHCICGQVEPIFPSVVPRDCKLLY